MAASYCIVLLAWLTRVLATSPQSAVRELQQEYREECPERCHTSCIECGSLCRGCSFCDPETAGPAGVARFLCDARIHARLNDQLDALVWSRHASAEQRNLLHESNRTVPLGSLSDDCNLLCYEVWASRSDGFTGFKPYMVSGVAAWSLYNVDEGLRYFKVRAIEAAGSNVQVARSSWSNVVYLNRVAGTTATATKTTTTTTMTTTTATSTTVTTSKAPGARTTHRALTTSARQEENGALFPDANSSELAAGGIEATLQLRAIIDTAGVNADVAESEAARLRNSFVQKIRSAIAGLLEVPAQRVHIMAVHASGTDGHSGPWTLTQELSHRRLQSETMEEGLVVHYAVLVPVGAERERVVAAVERSGGTPAARQRFAETLAQSGSSFGPRLSVDAESLRGAMIDAEWTPPHSSTSTSTTGGPSIEVAGVDVDLSEFGSVGESLEESVEEMESHNGWYWPALGAGALFVAFVVLVVAVAGGACGCCHGTPKRGIQVMVDDSDWAWNGASRATRFAPIRPAPERGLVPDGAVGFDPKVFDPSPYISAYGEAEYADSAEDRHPLLPKENAAGVRNIMRTSPQELSRATSHAAIPWAASSPPRQQRAVPSALHGSQAKLVQAISSAKAAVVASTHAMHLPHSPSPPGAQPVAQSMHGAVAAPPVSLPVVRR